MEFFKCGGDCLEAALCSTQKAHSQQTDYGTAFIPVLLLL